MSTAPASPAFAAAAILLREVLPNVLPTIVALLSLEMGIAVIVEAILSFVNLSISTDDPTWGGMIAEGRTIIHQAWWVLVFPLIVLFLTVLAFSQFGEGLKDALRSGAAMSGRAYLEISDLSAALANGARRRLLLGVADRRAGRGARAGRRERRRQEHDRQGGLRRAAARACASSGARSASKAPISAA